MKKKYSVDRISPGDIFTADAFSEGDILFASAGIPIKEKDLEGLLRWGITFVYSEGKLVDAAKDLANSKSGSVRMDKDDPMAMLFGGKAPGALDAVVDNSILTAYSDMVARLNGIMESIASNEKVDSKIIDKLSQDILQLVREKESALISSVISLDIKGYNLARSGVNSAILSIMVGQTLKLPAHRLMHLATGALLHDVGMLRIPDSIIQKKGALSPEEAQKMKAHPLISYRIITKELMYPEDIGLVALQHHERWDGAGYPRRGAGQGIDLLARIVSVADAFEAMISHKPYRDSMMGYTAIKNLLSDNSRRFDPDILKAFVKSIGIYPIGSTVVLNNAAIARVIDSHAEAPLRPKLKIIVDEFGKHYKDDTGDVLDLLSEKTLFIAKALNTKEISRQ
ncbi:HD-GYP domain-containing protein [Spirochaetota bacterium]